MLANVQAAFAQLNGWIFAASDYLDSLGLPDGLLMAIPFAWPIIIALFSRRILVIIAVVATSWLAVTSPQYLQAAEVVQDWVLVGYAAGFVIVMLVSIDAVLVQSANKKAKKRIAELEPNLSLARMALDREKLWRRAGGDDRPVLLDAEIVALTERVTKALNERRSGGVTVSVEKAPETKAPKPSADEQVASPQHPGSAGPGVTVA